MKQPGRAHVAALVIAIAMLLLAGDFVWTASDLVGGLSF
jgi:hypothetical protein